MTSITSCALNSSDTVSWSENEDFIDVYSDSEFPISSKIIKSPAINSNKKCIKK